MRWLQWKNGRQQTGYHKLLILQAYWLPIPFDLYLLKYPPGSSIPEHTDKVPECRHYRVNIVVKKAQAGGVFRAKRQILNWRRLKVFRSDYPHEVSPITKGTRYVLSLGICLKDHERSVS